MALYIEQQDLKELIVSPGYGGNGYWATEVKFEV